MGQGEAYKQKYKSFDYANGHKLKTKYSFKQRLVFSQIHFRVQT